MKDYYITNDKEKAKKKLEELFTTKIIQDVIIEKDGYRIEWINQKDFYKQSVETQSEMEKYLDFMIQKLEVEENRKEIKTDDQEEEEHKSNIFDSLTSKVNKKKTTTEYRSLDGLYGSDESMKAVADLGE